MITPAISLLDRLGAPGTGAAAGAAAPGGASGIQAVSFGSVLGDLAADAVGALQNAESTSLNALQGKVDTRTAVDAVMSAEQSLQAAIAIRDKVVTAYLEISRIQI
jgi:flagellar hook-basal body complex protein FliE